jgi:hypothetical protein
MSLFTISVKNRFDKTVAVAVGLASFGAGRAGDEVLATTEGPITRAPTIAAATIQVLRFMCAPSLRVNEL